MDFKRDYFLKPVPNEQPKLDVQEAINSIALPQFISKPTISQLNTSMIPIVNIAITFSDGLTKDNIEFTRETLKPLYEDIEAVANVDVSGQQILW